MKKKWNKDKRKAPKGSWTSNKDKNMVMTGLNPQTKKEEGLPITTRRLPKTKGRINASIVTNIGIMPMNAGMGKARRTKRQ